MNTCKACDDTGKIITKSLNLMIDCPECTKSHDCVFDVGDCDICSDCGEHTEFCEECGSSCCGAPPYSMD